MKVNIVSPQAGDSGKITKQLTYQRDASDQNRLVAVPMGLTDVEDLLPGRVAYKRSSTEVKNGRRRILIEDAVPLPSSFDESSGTPNGALVTIKVHTVIELPFTDPVKPGSGYATAARLKALNTVIRLHAMALLPQLATAGASNVNITGVYPLIEGHENAYQNAPVVRGSYGILPYGEEQELGLEDNTVE